MVFTAATDDKLVIHCKSGWLNFGNRCFIACREKLQTSFFIFMRDEVDISCNFSNSWEDFSKVKVNFTPTGINQTELNISKFDFSQNISIHNITNSLGLCEIDTLSLSNPRIVDTSKNHYHNQYLKNLIIKHSVEMSEVPLALFEIENLQSLQISDTSLEILKTRDFESLKNLIFLDLCYNIISVIEPGAFDDLENLQVLDISLNQFDNLPSGVFDSLVSLLRINLQMNKLKELSANLFLKNKGVKEIILKNNRLTSLPDGIFDNLNKLTLLNLKNNGLVSLQAGLFKDVNSLAFLYLERNYLKEIPLDMFENTSLITLRLRSNKLTKLNP